MGAFDVVDARVNVTGTTEQNLLAAYDTALISLEPDDETASEAVAISAQIVFASTLPDALLPSVRLAFLPNDRADKGFLTGAAQQAQTAFQHTGFLQGAVGEDDLAEGQRHAEHLVNTFDGEAGQFFNDWDRDGQFQNPGDGFGLRVYLDETQAVLLALQDLLDSPDVSADAAAQVATALSAIENSQNLVVAATERALQVFEADTITEAQVLGDELRQTAAVVVDDTTRAFDAIATLAEFRFYAPADVLASEEAETHGRDC